MWPGLCERWFHVRSHVQCVFPHADAEWSRGRCSRSNLHKVCVTQGWLTTMCSIAYKVPVLFGWGEISERERERTNTYCVHSRTQSTLESEHHLSSPSNKEGVMCHSVSEWGQPDLFSYEWELATPWKHHGSDGHSDSPGTAMHTFATLVPCHVIIAKYWAAIIHWCMT